MIYISFFVFFITQPNQVPDTLEPSYSTLVISSTLPEVRVYINGIYRGTTPITIDDIVTGRKYTLRLEKEDYESYSTTILFQAPIIHEKEIVLLEKKVKEPEEMEKICTQAEKDAQKDIDPTLWIGAGCLFNILAIGAGYIYQPEPSPDRLYGKSPEYVDYYTKCYKEAGRNIQMIHAGEGSLMACLIFIFLHYFISKASQ